MAYQPIEDYGIIGDLNTVALVGKNGSIDFLCFPRFDSPTVFAALLDDREGGRFQIAPILDGVRYKQLYMPDTNVLITRFLSADGVAEITDAMPVEAVGFHHTVVRRVKTVRGEARFRMICDPRFDYGRAPHRVEQHAGDVVFTSKGADGTVLRLRSDVPMRIRHGAAQAEFALRAGEIADFILEEVEEGSEPASADPEYISESLQSTVDFWRRWIGRSSYKGRWREMVNRSALTLKLLVSQPHGSLVAAPTFGLPEQVGGERNWDYRYTWVRDSAFTLFALNRLGFTDEAAAFMRWVEQRCGELGDASEGGAPLQVMYGVDGRHDLPEEILPHFEGYRGSAPVRIGNGACDQLQLDIYGELLDAVYLFNHHGDPISFDLWRQVARLADWVCENWRRKDEGIWEVRGGAQEFLYSRLMCWVALDRAVRIAWFRSFPAPLDRWMDVRDQIHDEIYRVFWRQDRGAFVQSRHTAAVDAASLLMPMMKFISFKDPRWASHLRVVERELVDDSLVYRYRIGEAAADGLHGGEGTFSMCSFWYVENLARCGRLDEARFFFEKMHTYANHLGLFAEQLGPAGEHLGNFPQAFTHLGLITAAMSLDQALSEAGWKA